MKFAAALLYAFAVMKGSPDLGAALFAGGCVSVGTVCLVLAIEHAVRSAVDGWGVHTAVHTHAQSVHTCLAAIPPVHTPHGQNYDPRPRRHPRQAASCGD